MTQTADSLPQEQAKLDALEQAVKALQRAKALEAKERGGPWVFHEVSRTTQRMVALAQHELNAALLAASPPLLTQPLYETCQEEHF